MNSPLMTDPPAQPPSDPTHLDDQGGVRMVNVGDKEVTCRSATAQAKVAVGPQVARAIRDDAIRKGNLLEVAKLAAIAAAKRTDELIPLCHSLPLDGVDVKAELLGDSVLLTATAHTSWKTGVEMEALTAVSVAALTVIDMAKSINPAIVIESVRLLNKTGGKRGVWNAEPLVYQTDPETRKITTTPEDASNSMDGDA